MRRSRRIRKTAALFAAGGMMLQFGGCDFFSVVTRNIPIGVGQTLGGALTLAVPAAALAGSIQPIIDSILGGTTTE